MSWQQMDSEEVNADVRRFEGVPHDDSYFAPSSGQKLSVNSGFSSPSWGQRLVLAIVSLVLWAIVFFVVILIITTTPAQIIVSGPNSPPTIVDNAKSLYSIALLLISGLLIFSAIIIVLNVLFNRRR